MSNALRRLGPRPLPLHALALWRAQALATAAATPAGGRLLDTDLERRVADAVTTPDEQAALAVAIQAETARRWADFWTGVAAYRMHPYCRPVPPRPAVHAVGATRLLDFAPQSDAPAILAIPSLVNTSDVLDLTPDTSLLAGLADAGFRPLLIDWGAPEPDAAQWTLDRYLTEKLEPLLGAVEGVAGRPPVVLGYCMGGLLAAALAASHGRRMAGLALLATPWNFHAPCPGAAATVARLAPVFEAAARLTGAVPTDILQSLFFSLDPTLAGRKFRHFAKLDPTSDEAELFVAMEDWVNGGPALAWPVARAVLQDWYGENLVHRGRWRACGRLVTPASFAGPTLVAAPMRDRIVPYESARAYADGEGPTALLDVDAGHVGMIVGHNAKDRLWRPLIEWLRGVAT